MKAPIFLFTRLFVAFLIFGFLSESIIAQSVEDPDPLRFEEEINRFEEFDSKNSFPEDAILFVGSSSIRLWKTAEAFPGMPVINRGFGGSHFSDLHYYYDELVLPHDPSVVVLYEGDNDVASGKSNDRVFEDYIEFADRLTSDFPDARLVFVPIKPSSSRWELWPQMKEANQRINEHMSENDQFYYVDLATPLLGSDGTPDDSLFLDDQLHLSEDGYAKWNAAIRPTLEKLMSE
ncbi:GDSL-type esterase/lipase family protein [Rhodohalobacter sulfatireducens]|uniref:GDSL-type esterase/lipase family protein n=1 Tax=Rhodohalobacter sulfatireducens TaxID=2911366 RepID=A0ABS9K9A6_9BACT|nr:GDSL-type esterase/lipase family protein [Rhodohalobacter sulfatireducens]MCG2587436.1 GDSL-type esterase/lipase family protein [Rhodohalobacter sulfatireducens]